MHESLMVLQAAIPVYLVVLLGAVLRGFRVLQPRMDKGLMVLAIHVFCPCLILDKMLAAEVLIESRVFPFCNIYFCINNRNNLKLILALP